MNTVWPFPLFALMMLLAGCNGAAERAVALRKSNLEQLATAYREFYQAKDRAPADAAELKEFGGSAATDEESDLGKAFASLDEGNIVVLWDGDPTADDQSTLAFEASVPGSGGYLVTAGGTVTLVTAKQFADRPTVQDP